jgi:hypothetical protein
MVSLPYVADDEREDDQREEHSEDDEGFELPPTVQLIPDLALKNITALSAFAEAQQAIVSNAMKPFLDAQAALQNRFSVINSDIFKIPALQQSNFNSVASQLAKNIDFGFSETMTTVASQFAAQQASWLQAIRPSFANIKWTFYPPNLQDIEGLKLEQGEEVVMVDGIPLYRVPRTSTAEALIRADSASKRRDVLGRRWKTIATDCREVVTACATAVIAPNVPFAVAALDALDAGHTEAAQALAASLIDAIIRAYFKEDRLKFTPDRAGKRSTDAYDEFTIRQFIAFAPMWQTYQLFFVEDGGVVRTTFSRHATAHTVNRRQYSRRNAVQALMFACSLLCILDEETAARTAA